MASFDTTLAVPQALPNRSSMAKVAAATMVGSAIEAFDFLAYGTAAALVFGKLFFPSMDGTAGTLAAFGAFATGFFARPVGGVIFGHFGDRLGRKAMLTLTLIIMGAATVLIGLLPTYASAGIWAPVGLVVLRLVQGLSFGGELAGAMLMAVEHAPTGRKSFYGSLPQGGTPVGLLLSTGAFAAASSMLSEADFLTWGWRIPFLASAILIAIGLFIRLKVAESPEFAKVKASSRTAVFPARDVLLHHWRPLLLTIGGKLGEVTLYFTIVVFSVSYAISTLSFARVDVLRAVMIGAACQIVMIPLFGWLGDRFGSRRIYGLGGLMLSLMAVPLFAAIGSGSLAAFTVAVPVALAVNYASMFGPQSDLYGAQFPAELRYSGMSLGIQIAAVIGGGLAPIVATTLVSTHGITSVGVYIAVLGLVAAICAALMRSPEPQA